MRLFVKLIPVSAGTAERVGEAQMLPCPPDVEPDTIRSFLTQKLGEPIEVAWTSTQRHERVQAGWIFPGKPSRDADAPATELLCVPFAEGPDGVLQMMFEILADQREEFERLASTGTFDHYQVTETPHRTYRPQTETGDVTEER